MLENIFCRHMFYANQVKWIARVVNIVLAKVILLFIVLIVEDFF